MKKFFISIVLLLAFISSAAAGEAIKPVSTSPITNFHEIWGIPWGVEYEEFAELAKQHSNILFELKNEMDSFASYVAIPEQNVTMFTYPVKITASFSGTPKCLSHISFEFLNSTMKADIDYGYAMFASLIKDLTYQYGSPTFAYFVEPFSDHADIRFSLPYQNGALDTETLKELRKNLDVFPAIYVLFGNVALLGEGIRSPDDTRIKIFILASTSKDILGDISELDITPYEEYDSLMNHPIPETAAPGSQLNVGL